MNRREFLRFTAAGLSITALVGGALFEQAGAQQNPASRFSTTFPASTNPADAARVLALGSRGVRIHDPSTIIKCKDQYWIFYTGRGVPSYHSSDLVKWEPGPPVLQQQPAWAAQAVPGTRGTNYWAPDVFRSAGRYLLYYCVSIYGKNISAIGLASNPTLDPADPTFHWTDEGTIIGCTTTDKYNTIDPAIIKDVDGKLWMSFGSYWSGIKLIELNPDTGKRIAPDSPIYSLAWNRQIEASYIYRHGEYFYLIVDWGLCCRGVNSTYNMRMGRSQKITGPYIDKDGKDLLNGGGSLLLASDGPFIGPGHAGIIEVDGKSWMSMHFYDRSRRGASALAIRPLRWGVDGWPIITDTSASIPS
jgi:arabinan endo-1,5-alpha-L-arabinosidase